MKSRTYQFFCGNENKLNVLITLSLISLIVFGCTCNPGNPLQKENNSPPASNTTSSTSEAGPALVETENTVTPPVIKTPKSTPTKTPEPPPVDDATPPVEVAYIHFLDGIHRSFGGKLKVGSPKKSSTRIEVRVEANGEPETLVVTQKSNDGRKATVVVGPKDAGAIRSYTLTLDASGWKITSVKDLDG